MTKREWVLIVNIGRLLEMNDLINTVIQKYKDLVHGKEVQANKFDRRGSSAVNQQDQSQEQRGPINLIDFDDIGASKFATASFDPFQSSSANQAPQAGPNLNDFNSLNLGNAQPSSQYGQPNLVQGFQPHQMYSQPQFPTQNQGFNPQYQQLSQQSTSMGKPLQQNPFGNPSNQTLAGSNQSKTIQSNQPFGDLFSLESVPHGNPASHQNNSAQNQNQNDLLGMFADRIKFLIRTKSIQPAGHNWGS